MRILLQFTLLITVSENKTNARVKIFPFFYYYGGQSLPVHSFWSNYLTFLQFPHIERLV